MSRKFSRIVSLLIVVALCLLTFAVAESTEPYRIAMCGPLTGPGAQYGQSYKNSLEILRDKINAEGGIDGHML